MTLRVVLVTLLFTTAAASSQPLTLACRGPFGPNATEDSLKKHFGVANVRSEAIQIGEGFTEPGTAVFPDDKARRVEILWSDAERKRSPSRVQVFGTAWQTSEGIRWGTTLRVVEKLNRRPFTITGFGWDYGGTAGTWSGGRLDGAADAPCKLVLYFYPGERIGGRRTRLIDSVSGEREFSSALPTMHEINPTVIGIELGYGR